MPFGVFFRGTCVETSLGEPEVSFLLSAEESTAVSFGGEEILGLSRIVS